MRIPFIVHRSSFIVLLALLPTSYFLFPPSSPTQQMTISGKYSISGQVRSGTITLPIFSDDIETGTFAKWNYESGGTTVAFAAAADDAALVGFALEQVTPDAVTAGRKRMVVFE